MSQWWQELDKIITRWPKVRRDIKPTQVIYSTNGRKFCWLTKKAQMVQLWPNLGSKAHPTRRLEHEEKRVKVIRVRTNEVEAGYNDPNRRLGYTFKYIGFKWRGKLPLDTIGLIHQSYRNRVQSGTSSKIPSTLTEDNNSTRKSGGSCFRKLSQIYMGLGYQFESEVFAQYKGFKSGLRRSPYRAMILFPPSALMNDEQLTRECKSFFELFPTVLSIVRSPQNYIFGTLEAADGRFRLRISPTVKFLRAEHGNLVSQEEVLRTIKYVGPKTVKCILSYAYGKDEIPVDRHVVRIYHRVFLGKESPKRISESLATSVRKELERIAGTVPDLARIDIHELMRLHGQSVCKGGAPLCSLCPISGCGFRKSVYGRDLRPARDAAKRVLKSWEGWRELLLEPMGS